MQRMPWSIRSTSRMSSASMMYDGGPSSPACAIRCSPASLARAKSRSNLAGGLPTSAESSPMPAIGASMASSCSSTSRAESSDRSRRNAAISRVEMPNSSPGSGQHRRHAVHAGLQRHPAGQVRLRIQHDLGMPDPGERRPGQVGPGHVGEVLLGLQHGHVGVVQVQEGLQVRELVARAQLVQVRVGQLDPVAFRQGEDQLRLQGSLDVQVEFRDRAAGRGPPREPRRIREPGVAVLGCPRCSVPGGSVAVVSFHSVRICPRSADTDRVESDAQ